MLCTCTVDELARKIHNHLVTVEHTHTLSVCYVGHVCNLHVLARTVSHHSILVLGFDDH